MQDTVQRPLIDVAPQRSRPGLAIALALLAIPGSTIAWQLPAGGLWIGLPLAVAAIVLGLRARQDLTGRSGSGIATAAIVIAALMIAQMAVWFVVEAVS
jgi:ABC-type microcin C transport system duplicated ATPase subunit YejF